MATVLSPHRVVASDRDVRQARDALDTLVGPDGILAVGDGGEAPTPLPPEIGRLLQEVLTAVAEGSTVTVSTVPAELTTVTAASLIGVSRPTLMKMVRSGRLPAHKVGTHTRLMSADVFAFIRERQREQRAAFDELRDLLDD